MSARYGRNRGLPAPICSAHFQSRKLGSAVDPPGNANLPPAGGGVRIRPLRRRRAALPPCILSPAVRVRWMMPLGIILDFAKISASIACSSAITENKIEIHIRHNVYYGGHHQ